MASPSSSWRGSTPPRSAPPSWPTSGARVIKVESADRRPPSLPEPTSASSRGQGGRGQGEHRRRLPDARGHGRSFTSSWPVPTSSCATTASRTAWRSGTTTRAWPPPTRTRCTCTPRRTDPMGPYTTRPAFAPTMGVAAGHRAYQLGWEHALGRTEPDHLRRGAREQLAAISAPTAEARPTTPTPRRRWSSAPAMLLGLLARQRTGQGQYLETTMLCSNAYVVSDEFFDYRRQAARPLTTTRTAPDPSTASTRPARAGCSWPRRWSGTGISCGEALAAVTGTDPLDDPRFETAAGRDEGGSRTGGHAGRSLRVPGCSRVGAALVPLGVACVEVNDGSFSDFTINEPDAWSTTASSQRWSTPCSGATAGMGPSCSLSGAPGTPGPGCLVGQHTRPILAELGYTEAQMADLRARGVVAWPD